METAAKKITSRLRLGKAAMEELGKVTKSIDVSLETKAKTIHNLVFPIPMYRCESWTVKADRKNLIHLKYGVG